MRNLTHLILLNPKILPAAMALLLHRFMLLVLTLLSRPLQGLSWKFSTGGLKGVLKVSPVITWFALRSLKQRWWSILLFWWVTEVLQE